MGLSSLGNQRPATTTSTISHSITGEADEVADLSVGDGAIADLFEKRRRKALAKAKGKKTKSKVALLADAAGMASPLTPLQAHAARVRAGRAEAERRARVRAEAEAEADDVDSDDPEGHGAVDGEDEEADRYAASAAAAAAASAAAPTIERERAAHARTKGVWRAEKAAADEAAAVAVAKRAAEEAAAPPPVKVPRLTVVVKHLHSGATQADLRALPFVEGWGLAKGPTRVKLLTRATCWRFCAACGAAKAAAAGQAWSSSSAACSTCWSRGTAFLDFSTTEDAEKALAKLAGMRWGDQLLEAEWQLPRAAGRVDKRRWGPTHGNPGGEGGKPELPAEKWQRGKSLFAAVATRRTPFATAPKKEEPSRPYKRWECGVFRDKGACMHGKSCRGLHAGREPADADCPALEECQVFRGLGFCKWGSECRHLHGGRASAEGDDVRPVEECRAFRDKGFCRWGEKCRHLHTAKQPRRRRIRAARTVRTVRAVSAVRAVRAVRAVGVGVRAGAGAGAGAGVGGGKAKPPTSWSALVERGTGGQAAACDSVRKPSWADLPVGEDDTKWWDDTRDYTRWWARWAAVGEGGDALTHACVGAVVAAVDAVGTGEAGLAAAKAAMEAAKSLVTAVRETTSQVQPQTKLTKSQRRRRNRRAAALKRQSAPQAPSTVKGMGGGASPRAVAAPAVPDTKAGVAAVAVAVQLDGVDRLIFDKVVGFLTAPGVSEEEETEQLCRGMFARACEVVGDFADAEKVVGVLQQLPVVALRRLSKEPGQLTQVLKMQADVLRSKRRSKEGRVEAWAMTTKKKVAPKKVVAKEVAPTLKLPVAPATWRKPARARPHARGHSRPAAGSRR